MFKMCVVFLTTMWNSFRSFASFPCVYLSLRLRLRKMTEEENKWKKAKNKRTRVRVRERKSVARKVIYLLIEKFKCRVNITYTKLVFFYEVPVSCVTIIIHDMARYDMIQCWFYPHTNQQMKCWITFSKFDCKVLLRFNSFVILFFEWLGFVVYFDDIFIVFGVCVLFLSCFA